MHSYSPPPTHTQYRESVFLYYIACFVVVVVVVAAAAVAADSLMMAILLAETCSCFIMENKLLYLD